MKEISIKRDTGKCKFRFKFENEIKTIIKNDYTITGKERKSLVIVSEKKAIAGLKLSDASLDIL